MLTHSAAWIMPCHAMPTNLEVESTLTDRYQTTVPETVRRALKLRKKDPEGYSKKNASKRLAAIVNLAFNIIPRDPSRPEYRQGGTLGEDRKHWFRAKFFQQYRLFFRYHAAAKIIVLAWVNDENTKRAYESSEDA